MEISRTSRSPPARRDSHVRAIGRFLDRKACALVLDELRFVHWEQSSVVDHHSTGPIVGTTYPGRISQTAYEEWFGTPLLRVVRTIERRLRPILHAHPNRYERWQATRYFRGGKFEYHLDAGPWHTEPAGDRAATVLVYLDSPTRGGGTSFKHLDLRITPKPGTLIYWNNLRANGTPDPAMLHSGEPVRAGQKTVLVTWIRERAVREE